MASLTSSANVPAPQTVYVPATTATTSEKDTSGSALTGEEAQELESEERRKGLLSRDRSRAGTILTSLSGVLDDSKLGSERKVLLGE